MEKWYRLYQADQFPERPRTRTARTSTFCGGLVSSMDMSVLVHVCLGLAQNKLFLVSVRLNIEHSMKLIGRTSNQLLKITNKSINISEIFIEKTVF